MIKKSIAFLSCLLFLSSCSNSSSGDELGTFSDLATSKFIIGFGDLSVLQHLEKVDGYGGAYQMNESDGYLFYDVNMGAPRIVTANILVISFLHKKAQKMGF